MAPPSVSLIYALREAADAYDERMAPLCAAVGLSLAQFNLLYLVVEEGPMRPSELARNRRCVKSNVSYLTRAMEKDGLLDLVADDEDRRVRHVRASKKGLTAFRQALRQGAGLEKEVISAVGQCEVKLATEQLLKMASVFDGNES